jgi:hypothetical protein
VSYSINVAALMDRASKRCNPATVATLLPDQDRQVAKRAPMPEHGSKVATVARSQARVQVRKGGNPLMTRAQGDACHAEGWSDAEIASFTARRDRLLRWGYTAQTADDLAERLTLRDRESDDRTLCVECQCASPRRRCSRDDVFLPERLQRCPSFKEIKP